jgi:hypothetical protein
MSERFTFSNRSRVRCRCRDNISIREVIVVYGDYDYDITTIRRANQSLDEDIGMVYSPRTEIRCLQDGTVDPGRIAHQQHAELRR